MSQTLALYMGSLILRSIGIAAIAGICVWKIRNVAVRHAIWVAVLGAILLTPAADYFLPAAWVPVRIQKIAAAQPVNVHTVSARAAGAPQHYSPTTAAVALPPQPKPMDLWNVAAMLYALVAFAMFIRLALGYRRLLRLRHTGSVIRSSVTAEIVAVNQTRWRTPLLLESEAVKVPMTIGFIRPVVILPADWKTWDEWKMRAVLLHEIAHIRRNDWGIAVIAAAAKCAYWLNPLTWFIERKLSQLAEQASDDASLYRTQNATRYAEILLEFAAATQNGGRLIKGGVAMAHHKIHQRIERVLGKQQPGTGIVKIAGWALVMIISVPVIYSAAALQVASEPVKASAPIHPAEFERNIMSQVPAAGQQAVPTPAPANFPQAEQNSANSAGDLRDFNQVELHIQNLLQNYNKIEQTIKKLEKYNQASAGPVPEFQNTTEKFEIEGYRQNELYKAQMSVIQAEIQSQKLAIARLQEQFANQLNPTSTQLEQLRANEAALRQSQARLASLEKTIAEQQRKEPSIAKAVTQSRYRVFVTGKVPKAGDFESDRPLTVLQALALAGGFQEFAKTDAISIIRMNGDSSTRIQFNYSNVISGVNIEQNIYLSNGDVVVVP